MVEVTVILPRALADDAGGRARLPLSLSDGADLAALLTALRVEAPAAARRIQDETGQVRRFVNVYVGETECRALQGLATPIPDGCTVHVIPSVAGGT